MSNEYVHVKRWPKCSLYIESKRS